MADFPLAPKWRLVGGLRYETTDINVHSESYLDSSVTFEKTNDTNLAQADLLPSAGLIYSITPKMNVRLNYSETLARPSFRELAAYYSYDTIINDFIEGNPELSMSSIQNYDVRWEWFPRPGELFSVSLFYKDIKNAIERGNIKIDGAVITFFNNDAKLYGIEFEARKTFDFLSPHLRYFSFGANLSLLESEVKLSETDFDAKRELVPDAEETRPLYDQSPYILNLDLSYSNPNSGTSAGLIFNIAGPRVVIARLNTDDVYDQPAPGLDFIFSQRLGRSLSIRFSAKNLLDAEIERTYGKESDSSLKPYSSYRRGRAFGISLSYEF
jgi:TonB-dependent receptor